MYCTLEDITRLSKTDYFAKLTIPGRDELAAVGEMIAGEIDGYLHQHGYDLPITDQVLLKYIASLNVFGTAAALERKGDLSKERKGFYETKYDKGIQMLKDRRWVSYTKLPAVTTSEAEW